MIEAKRHRGIACIEQVACIGGAYKYLDLLGFQKISIHAERGYRQAGVLLY